MTRGSQAGFTLVEVLVSLVLFSLIGLAGFSILESILRANARTEGRLEVYASLDRAFNVVQQDLNAKRVGGIAFDGASLSFARLGDRGALAIAYDHDEDALVRRIEGSAASFDQVILTEISTIEWRFFEAQLGWVKEWPPETDNPLRLRAIEMSVQAAGDGETPLEIRRLFDLPQEPS